MLKPLTLSLSLAVALGLCSVSMAGGYDGHCTNCGLASPQGVIASPQSPIYGCEAPCAPKKHCFSLPKFHCHLPKFHHEVCYEWVLKKKHSWSIQHQPKCDTCDYATPVYPTGQHGIAPSGQYGGVYGAPQANGGAYGALQSNGNGQRAFLPSRPTTAVAAAPAEITPATPVGEEVPPAPEVKESSANGSQTQSGLLLPTPSGN